MSRVRVRASLVVELQWIPTKKGVSVREIVEKRVSLAVLSAAD